MKRDTKPMVHIYFPEASNRGKKIDLCEYFYIQQSFQRKLENIIIKCYSNNDENDFKKAITSTNKALIKGKDIPLFDKFFIVFDTDIRECRDNLKTVFSQIQSLNNKYKKAKIVLSGRSFEVWLCMYNRTQYTKPFTTQNELNKDVYNDKGELAKYEKKRKWFVANSKWYFDEFQSAKHASIISKSVVFSAEGDIPERYDLVGSKLPELSEDEIINFFVDVTPYTYFEYLISLLFLINENPRVSIDDLSITLTQC